MGANRNHLVTKGKTRQTQAPQQEKGFSLISVAAFGAFVVMWLFAVTSLLLPTYQRSSSGRYQTVLRSAAEAGLDYIVADINRAISAGATSPFDDIVANDGMSMKSSIPKQALGNNAASVTATVEKVTAPAYSSIYNSLYATNSSSWRIVTATASYARATKTIRVILQANYTTTGGAGTSSPFFRYSMFGKSLINVGGNAWTDGYDSRLGSYGLLNVDTIGGDVGSNSRADLSANSIIGGDVDVRSQPPGSVATVATAGSNAIVKDRVILNGTSGSPEQLHGTNGLLHNSWTDNVWGLSRYLSMPDPAFDPTRVQQSNAQVEIPPAVTAPATAYDVGSISVSGTGKIEIEPGAPPPSGALNVSSGTVKIPPGDYKITNLTTSGSGVIEIASNVATPVRFFVEGNVVGTNAIQVVGNGIVNKTNVPAKMQLWYNGAKDVMLAGNGNMYAVAYAPNAQVSISGNGSIFGSIVGDAVIDSGNGAVHFDKALMDSNANYGMSFIMTGYLGTLQSMRTISWQEQ